MQTGNQNEVADDVDDTCDEDEQERRFAVAKSAENRRQQVVGDDEENPAAADTNITCRQSDCFSRSLHEYRDGAGKENHSCEQADRKQCEYNRRAADDGADLFRVLFPEITGDQDSDAHCELCHNKGDKVQHLAAGGNRRQSGGGAESADDEQIDGAVGSLEYQRAQNRNHKRYQFL